MNWFSLLPKTDVDLVVAASVLYGIDTHRLSRLWRHSLAQLGSVPRGGWLPLTFYLARRGSKTPASFVDPEDAVRARWLSCRDPGGVLLAAVKRCVIDDTGQRALEEISQSPAFQFLDPHHFALHDLSFMGGSNQKENLSLLCRFLAETTGHLVSFRHVVSSTRCIPLMDAIRESLQTPWARLVLDKPAFETFSIAYQLTLPEPLTNTQIPDSVVPRDHPFRELYQSSLDRAMETLGDSPIAELHWKTRVARIADMFQLDVDAMDDLVTPHDVPTPPRPRKRTEVEEKRTVRPPKRFSPCA